MKDLWIPYIWLQIPKILYITDSTPSLKPNRVNQSWVFQDLFPDQTS